MDIYAKSALQKDQLDAKIAAGATMIEIQLLAELIDGKLGSYFMADEVFDLSEFKGYPIRAVHTPLLGAYGMSDVNIESFLDSDFKLIDQVFYIANYYGKVNNMKVLVVVHSESDRQNMMLISDTWKKVLNGVGCLLFKYPYTELAIENVSPLRNPYGGDVKLCNNFHFDNVVMAKELRHQLNTDRVGTVLDTCHAMIASKYISLIYDAIGDTPPADFTMDAFFRENAEVLKLIHLSDMTGSGYGKGKHGIPFTEETKWKLSGLLELYKKYNCTCPVTLEVEENDLLSPVGFSSTLARLKESMEG